MVIIFAIITLVICGLALNKWRPSDQCPRCGELYPGKNHAMKHLVANVKNESIKPARKTMGRRISDAVSS